MTRSIWSITRSPRSSGTRDRLIDAAACLFYAEGFHAAGDLTAASIVRSMATAILDRELTKGR